MKKKIWIVLLCVAATVGVVACHKTDTSEDISSEIASKTSNELEQSIDYHKVDNACIYFKIQYDSNYPAKFTWDNIDSYVASYVSECNKNEEKSFEHYEKYKETEDLFIYKIYNSDAETDKYLSQAIDCFRNDKEYLEDYVEKYFPENQREKEKKENDYDCIAKQYEAAVEAYERYKKSNDYPMQVLIAVKNTNEKYIISECSHAFMSNIDAFIEGIIYLNSKSSDDIPIKELGAIGYTKPQICSKLGFYLPDEVKIQECGIQENTLENCGEQCYGTDLVLFGDNYSLPESPDLDEYSLNGEKQDEVISKFLGFWIWEDDYDNGIEIAGGAETNSYEEDKYIFMVTHGDVWSERDLISYSNNQLVFQRGNDEVGYHQVILTYIDYNTIECTYKTKDGISTLKAFREVEGDSVDVDKEVKKIRTWYYDTQYGLDKLVYSSYDTNLYCYFDGGYPAKVVAKSGYNGWNATREYYYHDNKLYFIFIYGEMGEYRYYIKDDKVIRSITPDGKVVDIGNSMKQDAWKLVDRAFDEIDTLPSMVNCGA